MKKNILILFFTTCYFSAAFAIPAFRRPIPHTQTDGTSITIHQNGDEYFHYLTNEKGQWVKKNNDGNYEIIQPLSTKEMIAHRMNSPKMHRLADKIEKASPLNMAPRGLIILVNFTNLQFAKENSLAAMQEMANGENYTYNGATGSAQAYFRDQSMGQYVPIFDVVGPVTIDSTMEYYGKNDQNGNDKHPALMIKQACQKANDQFDVNFADYDNNNDGYVDWVYVIYAGYGEADSEEENTIWPHTWYISEEIDPSTKTNISLTLDGKIVDSYACSSELDYLGDRAGIGTLCHEFTHVLGFPDLYETTGNGDWKTLGEWDIMDYGSYNNGGKTPPAYSAYERFFFGWLTPTELSKSQTVTLDELQESNQGLIVCKNGTMQRLQGNDPLPTTFYILENRQKKGWDAYIPGHGLLITKVLYSYAAWYDGIVNNNENVLGVDLIEADGKAPYYSYSGSDYGWFGKEGDAFPKGATFYEFDQQKIYNIKEDNGIISFDFSDGKNPTENITKEPSEKILKIYTLTGQVAATTLLNELPAGIYIIETETDYKKICIK